MALYRIIPRGDIALVESKNPGKRTIGLVTRTEYVRQKISCRLKFFHGEWFRDLRVGVPWVEYLLRRNVDFDIVQILFRNVITSVQEVRDLVKLDLTPDLVTRKLGVGFHVLLVDGGELVVRQPDPAFVLDLNLKRAS